VAIAAGSGPVASAGRGRPRGLTLAGAAAGCAVLLVCAVSLALPYLAERHLDRGSQIGLGDVPAAREELDRAASLDPLSPEPHLRAGTILVAARRPAAARGEFRRAIDVEDNWYAHLELALLAAEAERRRAALAELARARALDRHDPLLGEALARIRSGRRIDAAAFNSEIRRTEAERFTRPKS
jgi:Tfp pilus assembly protein PilF